MAKLRSITLKQMAQYALDLQKAKTLAPLLHSWASMQSRIAELIPAGEDADRHPINLLIAAKARQLIGDGSEIELTRAFYKVREIIES